MSSNVLNLEGSHVFNYTTTGAVTAGALLIVGSTPMVALSSAAGAGEVIACAVGVEAVLTKKAQASALAAGGRAYYVATGGVNKICSTAAAGKLVGYMTEAATTTATTAKVRLIGGPMPLETQT
jgi:predicted RecA/RadA family phage recombinase